MPPKIHNPQRNWTIINYQSFIMKHTNINQAQYIGDRRKAHGARIRDKPEVVGEAVTARGADPFPDDPGYRGAVSEEERVKSESSPSAPLVSTSG